MQLSAEAGREFWRGVLVAGGVTTVPRWTLEPVAGVATLEAIVPDDLTAALHRLASTLAVPLSSVLLTAHAKVAAALSGDDEVTTGYVAAAGASPLPCPLSIGPGTWRALLLASHQAESHLLRHQDFPVDDLRRELALPGPSFETVFDPHGDGGDLAPDTVLRVGFAHHGGRLVLRLRYRTDVLDGDCAARIAGYHLTALALLAAEPDAEHGRQSLLSAEEVHAPAGGARRAPTATCRTAASTSCSRSRCGAPRHRRGCARRTAVDLPGAQRPREPAGACPAGAGTGPRGRRGGRDGAQPGLDGRSPRRVQGRRRVPARSSRTSRPTASRPRSPAPDARSWSPSSAAPRRWTRPSTPCRTCRRCWSTRRTRREQDVPRRTSGSPSPPASSPTSTSPPARRVNPREPCASTRACSTTCTPRSTTCTSPRVRWSPRSPRSASTSRCGSWSRRLSSAAAPC